MAHFEYYDLPQEAKDKIAHLRWEMAVNRVLLAGYRLIALLEKANFNPNQPRAPAGQPDGGEWARVADAGGTTSRSPTSRPLPRNPTDGSATSRPSRASVGTDRSVTLHYPDGSTETRTGGTRSWRNNNPHNIVAGPFANAHGAIGSDGGMAVFPDEATGQAAAAALLKTETYSRLTIDQAIARRSPPNENETATVQRNVRRLGNFSGNEIVGQLTPVQSARLVRAIQMAEGWREGTVTRSRNRP